MRSHPAIPAFALVGEARAQRISGVLGSQNATSTVHGDQLPPSPQPFRGSDVKRLEAAERDKNRVRG